MPVTISSGLKKNLQVGQPGHGTNSLALQQHTDHFHQLRSLCWTQTSYFFSKLLRQLQKPWLRSTSCLGTSIGKEWKRSPPQWPERGLPKTTKTELIHVATLLYTKAKLSRTGSLAWKLNLPSYQQPMGYRGTFSLDRAPPGHDGPHSPVSSKLCSLQHSVKGSNPSGSSSLPFVKDTDSSAGRARDDSTLAASPEPQLPKGVPALSTQH